MEKLSAKRSAFLAAISGVYTALSQITEGWYISLVSIIPLYLCLFFTKGRQTVAAVWTYLFVYHSVLFSFLVTLYDYLSISALLSVLLCIAAVTALSALISFVVFIAVFPAIKLETESRLLKVAAFAACFSLGQFLTEIVPVISFPWAKLENALVLQPVLLQSAALLGGNFTAFLLLLFNGTVACVLIAVCKEDVKQTLKYSLALSLLFSVVIAGGSLYMMSKKPGEVITVAAVQGSDEGILKNAISSQTAAKEYSKLISELGDNSYDVILLPETAIPDAMSDENMAILSEHNPDLSPVVAGCIYQGDGDSRYNCLAALSEKRSMHLKQVLVPIGEYMPFFKLEGFASLTPSDTGGTINLGGRRYAAMICIESIYSVLLSPQVDSGSEMILVSTNDSWFKNSYARELHFRHCIVRAAEYDRYLLRSGNCGISALIDRSGNIITAQYGKERAAVTAQAQLLSSKTLYASLGNIFQIPAVLFVSSFYVLALLRKITDKAS